MFVSVLMLAANWLIYIYIIVILNIHDYIYTHNYNICLLYCIICTLFIVHYLCSYTVLYLLLSRELVGGFHRGLSLHHRILEMYQTRTIACCYYPLECSPVLADLHCLFQSSRYSF